MDNNHSVGQDKRTLQMGSFQPTLNDKIKKFINQVEELELALSNIQQHENIIREATNRNQEISHILSSIATSSTNFKEYLDTLTEESKAAILSTKQGQEEIKQLLIQCSAQQQQLNKNINEQQEKQEKQLDFNRLTQEYNEQLISAVETMRNQVRQDYQKMFIASLGSILFFVILAGWLI
jgi:DNA repair exonuclease SbcCD ATPase subunit